MHVFLLIVDRVCVNHLHHFCYLKVTEDINVESDDDTEELVEEQLTWRRSTEDVAESLQLKKPLDAICIRFGTQFYENPRVLTCAAPSIVQLGKGTTGT